MSVVKMVAVARKQRRSGVAVAAALLSLTHSLSRSLSSSLENFLALSGCFSRLLLARGRKVGIANEVPSQSSRQVFFPFGAPFDFLRFIVLAPQ